MVAVDFTQAELRAASRPLYASMYAQQVRAQMARAIEKQQMHGFVHLEDELAKEKRVNAFKSVWRFLNKERRF